VAGRVGGTSRYHANRSTGIGMPVDNSRKYYCSQLSRLISRAFSSIRPCESPSPHRSPGFPGFDCRFDLPIPNSDAFTKIARPEILDAGRIERNHPRRDVVFVRHRTARAEPAFCLTLFSASISIMVVCKSAVVDLLTKLGDHRLPPGRCCAGTCRSWPTPARSILGHQQRPQAPPARAARVAGLTLSEEPARRRLAVLTPSRTRVLLNFSRTDFCQAPCGGRALMGGKPLLCVFVTASGGSLYPC
jgi:hypothetical protein